MTYTHTHRRRHYHHRHYWIGRRESVKRRDSGTKELREECANIGICLHSHEWTGPRFYKHFTKLVDLNDDTMAGYLCLCANQMYTQSESKRERERQGAMMCVCMIHFVRYCSAPFSILFSIQFVFGSNSLKIHTFDSCISCMCVSVCVLKCTNGYTHLCIHHFSTMAKTLNRKCVFILPFRLNTFHSDWTIAMHNLHASLHFVQTPR